MIRNIALVGTMGNAKSSTANTLFGFSNGPFPVSSDSIAHTKEISHQISEQHKIRIIDTPGFNDNTTDPKEIEKILAKLTDIVINFQEGNSSHAIDAFLLPRIVTSRLNLNQDIEDILMLYGRNAWRSLIILYIWAGPTDKKPSKEKLLSEMREMQAIEKIKRAKANSSIENWFMMWDNLNPLPGQINELLYKMSQVVPYTNQNFKDALLEKEKKKKEEIREIKRQAYAEYKVRCDQAEKNNIEFSENIKSVAGVLCKTIKGLGCLTDQDFTRSSTYQIIDMIPPIIDTMTSLVFKEEPIDAQDPLESFSDTESLEDEPGNASQRLLNQSRKINKFRRY